MCGCAHLSERAIPPMFEDRHPFIVGVSDSDKSAYPGVNTLLLKVITNSGLASGVVNEPFDKELVDVIVKIEELSLKEIKSGFIPKRMVVEGSITIDFFNSSDSEIGSYTAEGIRERSSMNPFSSDYESDYLLTELISDVLDDFADDIEENPVSLTHKEVKEEKVGRVHVGLLYPILTEFRRNTLKAEASIRGKIPPSLVEISLSQGNGEVFVTEEFFFTEIEESDGLKEWSYNIHMGKNILPLGSEIKYEVSSHDVMGNYCTVRKGEFRTISKGFFKLKQVEAITHGALITTFGGLAMVMLLYSL
jgi:hypothetical protein